MPLINPGPLEWDTTIQWDPTVPNATGWVDIPFDLKATFGKANMVPVVATFDGTVTYRGSIAKMWSGSRRPSGPRPANDASHAPSRCSGRGGRAPGNGRGRAAGRSAWAVRGIRGGGAQPVRSAGRQAPRRREPRAPAAHRP